MNATSNSVKPLVNNFAKPHVCIDSWEIITHWGVSPRLRGLVRNHPEIPDGEMVITSGIVSYDPRGSWIETQSSIYILGIPAGMEGTGNAAVVDTQSQSSAQGV